MTGIHPSFAARYADIVASGDHCPDCGRATQPVRPGQIVQCLECDPTAAPLRAARAKAQRR